LRDLQTLVISMLRSPDRRQRAAEELTKTSIEWQFLDAVDGKLLTAPIPEYLPEKVKSLLGFELMPGEIGAFLSHKKAWQACVDQNKPTLIFEDDFILFPQFEKTIDYLLNAYQGWSLVRLQALEDSSYKIIHEAGDFVIAENEVDALGCTAYLVKPDAAQKLIDGARYIYEPIDHYIEHKGVHGLSFLAIRPYPSDISQSPTTVYRPDRASIRGWRKIKRSIHRWLDRIFSKNPWFPK
jgi:glycosyl transferase, family 25